MKIGNWKLKIIIFLIILVGAFLRFYKLDWGNGLFAHPDEYHIVASVNQLSFPNQMHPHFFSYGTVTIYLIYFTKELLEFINSHNSLFIIHDSPFLLGRFYSAIFSTLTIFVIYKISKTILPNIYALLSAFLVAITPGLIQQAHFTTPESNLIFFLFTSLLFLIYFSQEGKIRYILFASVFLGLALGVKISSIVFLAPLIVAITVASLRTSPFVIPSERSESRNLFIRVLKFFGLTLASLTIAVITLAIVAPFIFLDFPAFWGNLNYEGSLAAGNIPVFYTRQFINTIPILFQFEKIYPYALGIPLLIAGIGGFFLLIFHLRGVHSATSEVLQSDSSEVKRRRIYFILLLSFLCLFIPNAFLFTKWTRFIAPTFTFFAIFSAFFLWEIHQKWKRVSHALACIFIITTTLWTYAFFNIYKNPDIRITASNWLIAHIKPEATILVEGGNMIDVPLSGNYKKISLVFYDIEEDTLSRQKIVDGLFDADYFIVQSRRVFLNHQRARKQFPKTAHFYDLLFAGDLGFTQIKEFHSYPTISFGKFSVEFLDEQAEETWSVFDHPVIRIFKKNAKLSKDDYAKIFEE